MCTKHEGRQFRLGVKTYVTNAEYCESMSSGGGDDNYQLQIIFTGVNEPCVN